MNKTLFAILVIISLLVSCDAHSTFIGDSEPQDDFEPPTVVEDSIAILVVDSTTKEPEESQLTESVTDDVIDVDEILKKDSLQRANEELERTLTTKHAEEKRRMLAELRRIKEANKPVVLKRSTYKPLYPKAVERILYELQIRYIKSMKANKVASFIRPELLKLFTMEYCDDRMLEWIDSKVESNLEYISKKTRIDIDKCIQDKALDADAFMRISSSRKRK